MRLAIVTPWFGRDLRGGAEQQAFQLARQFAARGHTVDVLTTCCRAFSDDWASNTLRAGIERVGDVTVRRFKTDRRDRRGFERINAQLLALDVARLESSISPVGYADAATFCGNGINSSALLDFLAEEGASYQSILFLPYMFGTTLFGLPIVADRAYLQPCLHREAYAYLPQVAAAVHAAKGLLFNSDGELAVAVSLFGPGIIAKSAVVGEGIDFLGLAAGSASVAIGDFVPRDERYVLYLGRQDPAKNVATLVAAFKHFRREAPATRLQLVFAGERHTTYADTGAGIVDLGPVSEVQKRALLAHARVLAQPSTVESFSRVIYEAWLLARPVLVHADCPPTANAVARCDGGFIAGSTDAWHDAFHRVDGEPDSILDDAGRRGRDFARVTTEWASVLTKYERAFARPAIANRWDGTPDVPLRSALADGKSNLLYAGPIGALDPLEQLLIVFLYYLTLEREARLSIVACGSTDDVTYEALQHEVRRLDLVDRIIIARDLSIPQLHALYTSADVYLSLDRDVDGTPGIRDAMWFDVPVLAVDSRCNREVTAGTAILLSDSVDLPSVAALAELLVHDDALRRAIVSAQQNARVATAF